jgi:CBS-domain-containing membrane protein
MNLIAAYLDKMRGGKQVPPCAPLHEVFWSAIGAFIGIYSVYYIGHLQELHLVDSLFLVGSFGATAVLVYGIPNSPYSQPRNLIGGHIISAIVGVSCALLLSSLPELAAATAVALSLILMHVTRTVHPPGGATTLIAVIGSDQIHEMGYMFVVTPVATGAVIMLVVALVINNLSPYRRYPQYWF